MPSLDGLQMFLQELDRGQQRLNEAVQSANMEREKQFGRNLKLLENGLELDAQGNLKEVPLQANPLFQQQIKQKAAFDPNFMVGQDGSLIVDPSSPMGVDLQRKAKSWESQQKMESLDLFMAELRNKQAVIRDPLELKALENSLQMAELQKEDLKIRGDERRAKIEQIKVLTELKKSMAQPGGITPRSIGDLKKGVDSLKIAIQEAEYAGEAQRANELRTQLYDTLDFMMGVMQSGQTQLEAKEVVGEQATAQPTEAGGEKAVVEKPQESKPMKATTQKPSSPLVTEAIELASSILGNVRLEEMSGAEQAVEYKKIEEALKQSKLTPKEIEEVMGAIR